MSNVQDYLPPSPLILLSSPPPKQCFLTFIAPFDWRHPCVPILPRQLLECLDAP